MSVIAHGIRTLGIVGAGQMGTGIALVGALRAKVPVLLHDRSPEQIKKGLSLVDKLLAKDVGKGRLTSEQAKEARDRISVGSDVKSLRDVDMVVEASIEELRPDAILATNTSSISITKIAASAIPNGVSAASNSGKQSAGRVVGIQIVLIGLDTCLAIQQTLYEGTRDSKYRPSVLLERMVDAQWLGKKNGKGFYEYDT
ncbi:hypothetical protein C0993_002865 [Termitomyces sp. T159_Od127]|nr:hypothetical protein C0993_002865 [Termitomyces sp. T159_Od127]